MNKVILLCTFLLIFSTMLVAQIPEWLWAERAGGSEYDHSVAIITDTSGIVDFVIPIHPLCARELVVPFTCMVTAIR